jgi:hypothetical protein
MTEAPQTEQEVLAEIDPDAAPIDVISDWVQKLIDARVKEAEGKAEKEEARDIILAHMAEAGKKIGVVNGAPVLEIKTKPNAFPPSLAKLDAVSVDIGEKTAKAVWEVLKNLGIATTLPSKMLVPAIQAIARGVLEDYTSRGTTTSVETARFKPKASKQS